MNWPINEGDRSRGVQPIFVSRSVPEIMQILTEIVNNEEAIKSRENRTYSLDEMGQSSMKPITLLDAFQVINRYNYLFLWNVTLKAVTIMPTTVSCERQFSRLRHKLHNNLAKEASFAFMCMSHNRNRFTFDKTFMKTRRLSPRVWNPPPDVFKRIDLMKHMKTPGRAAHVRRCAASESPNARTPEPERNRRPRAEDLGKPRCNRPPPIAGPRARRASPSDDQLYVMFQTSKLTRSLSFVFQLTRVKLERKGELC